ncbi:MAG: hypothetical protein KDE27_27530 [Planctomycetes bacterium]|nr:hypothetical protein [Planctomycetota bacterium]
MRFSSLVSLALFAPFALAQTYIVDANNGPGTDFVTLAAATAAVPDGSVLLVRVGNYADFQVANKGLKILAEPGALLVSGVQQTSSSISGVPAGKSVVVRGLLWAQGLPTGRAQLHCTASAGAILIEGLRMPASGRLAFISVRDCEQVVIRDMRNDLGPTYLELRQSHTVLENCAIGGGLVVGSGVVQHGGSLQVVDCDLAGGFPFGTSQPTAVEMHGGELRMLGATTLFTLTAFAVGGTAGNVRADPSLGLSPSEFAPTLTVGFEAMPTLTTRFASGIATAELGGPSGAFGAIAIALPGPRLALSGADDPLWLDVDSFAFLAFGTLGSTPLTRTLSWSGGLVPGARTIWQGASLGAAGFAVSNPSALILP